MRSSPRARVRRARSLAFLLLSTLVAASFSIRPSAAAPALSDHVFDRTEDGDWAIAGASSHDGKTADLAQQMLEQLGDRHSMGFYRKVAQTVPDHLVHRALSETKEAKHGGRW
jgi:hypothetical protein